MSGKGLMRKYKGSVKVAAVQYPPVFLDKDATIDRARDLVHEASENGAEVVAFSECYISGYPAYYTSGMESETGELIQYISRVQENSVRIPSQDTERVCEAAKEAEVYVLMGCNELDDSRGKYTLYNSQFLANPEGELVYSRRKLMPTHTERTYHGLGDGSDLKVTETEFGNLGSLICWEHHMSLLRAAMIKKGEHIHVGTWPGSYCVAEKLATKDISGNRCDIYPAAREYSFEAGAFTVSVNAILNEKDVPEEIKYLLDSEHMDIDWACGGSCIINPLGEIVEGPEFEKETILYHNCNLELRKVAKLLFDHEGHYSRDDVFNLEVRERPLEEKAKIPKTDEITEAQLEQISEETGVELEKVKEIIENFRDLRDKND